MRVLTSSVVVLSLAAAVAAQEKPPVPKGYPPQFCLASATGTGDAVTVQISQLVSETHLRTVDGKPVQVAVSKWAELKPLALGKQVRAYRADGKPAGAAEVLKALSKPTGAAVIAAHGPGELPEPDPFYLGLLREGTVVLVFRWQDARPEPQGVAPPPPTKKP